ncbi:MAG TPA: alpha/beta hydrolase [Gemmatimonadaceae bacterium]|nr:alpha/beta hydrolase [Gemmatimonadaceae bacterium]
MIRPSSTAARRGGAVLRVPVGPGSLHVEQFGPGNSPVLLVHGFGTSTFLWREVAPLLTARNRTAMAVDLLGYGESDRPAGAKYGIAAQSSYLDLMLDSLRVLRATVVGVDLGGAIALHLAATHPDRVKRLLLINPIALNEIPGGDIKRMKLNTARNALRLSRGVLGAATLLKPLLRGGVARPEAMPDSLLARYLAPYVGREGLDHLLVLGRSVIPADMADIPLDHLKQRTVIVWGERDPFLSPRLPDRLAAVLKGSRVIRLPAVARLVPEEAPEALATMILEFAGGALHG